MSLSSVCFRVCFGYDAVLCVDADSGEAAVLQRQQCAAGGPAGSHRPGREVSTPLDINMSPLNDARRVRSCWRDVVGLSITV